MHTNSDVANMPVPLAAHINKAPAIEIANVAVRYRMPNEQVTSLKEVAIRRVTGRKVTYSEFYALNNINATIQAGEAVALIGRNGAGKSTLLKVISRVQVPTKGRIIVRGKMSPMIELGAGFHPELTGRENVYLNGAMLGHSRKEMDSKMQGIIDFSELHNFIDSPLRTYSTGMIARLGFAIASEVDPEILIIDEVLAVGDESFQRKCIERMQRFRDRGITILFVTHALDTIAKLCSRCIWIGEGHVVYDGPTEKAVRYFQESMQFEGSLSETRMRQVVIHTAKR